MKRRLSWLVLACLWAFPAHTHEVRPAYLEVRQVAPDTYDVLWKVPALGDDRRLGIYVRLPVDVKELSERRGLFSGGAYIERWRVRRAGGLDGQAIGIDGLAATRIDVLARVERAGGASQTARLLPDAPSFVVEAAPSGWSVAATYLVLGVEHILLGIDHLLFVLALVLLVKGWKPLVGTITAFTIAHSVTLAAATLGLVHVPGPPVEAAVALSIAFVATEIVQARRGREGLAARMPWMVAFAFGLLHGFGFAGALSETGLPEGHIPVALLFFNLGVEAGQLLFIAGVLALIASARGIRVAWPRWAELVPPYAIGSLAMFWLIQRVTAF
jgi:hydrogenase/urease accessory protein HupE